MRFHHHNPGPEIFGEDLGQVGYATGGMFLTFLGNDKIVAPLIDQFVPTLDNNQTIRKIVDAGTTLGSAFVISEVLGRVVGGRMAMQLGGSILGLTRFLTAFVPGLQLSPEVPNQINFPPITQFLGVSTGNLPGASGATTPQLTSQSSFTGTAQYASQQPNTIGQSAYALQGGI